MLISVAAALSVTTCVTASMRPVSMAGASRVRTVLERAEWLPLAEAHSARVASALGVSSTFEYDRADPLRNFVFQYYHLKPSQLRVWCPGPDVAMRGVTSADFGKLVPHERWARAVHGSATLYPAEAAPEQQRVAMTSALAVLRAAAGREPHLLCHGLHEWAMLYHPASAAAAGVPPPPRHQGGLPLRVSQAELNACVESLPLRCTHFDAFRFFAPEARPLNREGPLSRARQAALEQPGCVHATMDLFKWALRALPFIDAALVPETLALALKARVLDMRASPYDLGAWDAHAASARAFPPAAAGGAMTSTTRTRGGRTLAPLSVEHLAPIRIESRDGRDEYRAYQLALYEESRPVRAAMIAQYENFFAAADSTASL
ncbi:hypothetical protein KFE25_007833 [Diacronema lutheri]|uniref:Uncharacterized protein n=1 Tax=Diacronema lutheri TaxID=2081491 RepID=A0A8J5Y100_DIALT|nr:hypothetical protein KFE25_007833 [Diacronema lutheri]